MKDWLGKVWAVAAFEARLSRRMWRVWILGFLVIWFPLLALVGYGPVMHRSFSGLSGPASYITGDFAVFYSGLILAGLCSLMGIFFVFDWRRRDTAARFDLTYDASALSPNQYALGKFLGLAVPYPILFLILATAQLLWSLIDDVPIAAATFLVADFWGGLLVTLGLVSMAFGIAGATRSRALAIIIPLAWFGCVIAIAFTMPELLLILVGGLTEIPVYSALVGYSLGALFWGQRLASMALIAALVCLGAIGGYGPQRSRGGLAPHWLAVLVSGGLYLACLGSLAWQYTAVADDALTLIQAERDVARLPVPGVLRRELSVELAPEQGTLKGLATLTLINDGEASLERLPLRLNAGLEVNSVTVDGQQLDFEREGSVLLIEPPAPLPVGQELALTVSYEGGLDLLSIDALRRLRVRDTGPQVRPNLRFLGTVPAYLEKGAVILAMDLAWYPQVGMLFGHEFPARRRRSLAPTTLEVKAPADWTVISAGRRSGQAGTYRFEMEAPIPALSLCAGPYVEHELEVAGITFRLAEHPGGHSNVDFFAEIEEVLKIEIETQLELIEERTGLTYPYPELSLVEVPQHMAAYGGGWDAPNRFAAPGVVMFREGGILGARFERVLMKAEFDFKKDAGAKDAGDESSTEGAEGPDEFDTAVAKLDLLKRFTRTDWLGGDVERLAMRSFWDYRLSVEDESGPILEFALSNYVAELALERATVDHPAAVKVLNSPEFSKIQQGMVAGSVDPDHVIAGLADVDEVYREMLTIPLHELKPEGLGGVFVGVMHAKGRQPLSALRATIGKQAFKDLLGRLREQGQDELTWLEFTDSVRAVASAEQREGLSGLLEHWQGGVELPGFVVTRSRKQRLSGEEERWQVLTTVRNVGTAGGTAKFQAGKGDDARTQVFSLDAGETMELGLVMDREPEDWRLSPYLSLNRYQPRGSLSLVEETSEGEAFTGLRSLPTDGAPEPIIVDNLDAGFTLTLKDGEQVAYGARDAEGGEPLLKPINEGLLILFKPSQWKRWRGGRDSILYSPYGQFDTTAAMKNGTDSGDQPARWQVNLPSAGTYRVEAFLPPTNRLMKNVLADEFHFVVVGRDGESEVTLSLDASEKGWNDLGRFELDRETEVQLLDLGDGLIVADAIRFIKEDS